MPEIALAQGVSVNKRDFPKIHFYDQDFVDIYDKFKNEENVTLDLSLEERNLYDLFKKYKQASSEGTRKLINRMARFDVLKHFLLEDDSTDELVSSLCEKLEKM